MSHWYLPDHTLLGPIVTKDGWRDPTLRDARKVGAVPSVTTILQLLAKAGLDKWKLVQVIETAIRHAWTKFDGGITLEEVLATVETAALISDAMAPADEAADFGTQVHAGISEWVNGVTNWGQGYSDIRVARVVKEFIIFAKARAGAARLSDEITFSESEHTFVDTSWGYAGTVDLIGTHGGQPALFDLKTQDWEAGKKPNFYDEWPLQLSGYRLGLNLPSHTCLLSIVLNRSIPGDIQVKEWEDVARWDQAWRSVLRAWQLIHNYYPGQARGSEEEGEA